MPSINIIQNNFHDEQGECMLRKIGFTMVVLAISATSVYATDFSQYSNEELMGMKSEASSWDANQRQAFQTEMKLRMQSMSQEERKALMGSGNAQGKGGQRLRDGSGMGQGGQGKGRY